MRDLLGLTPDELRATAKRLLAHKAADHWSRVALVLGRIDAERLFARYTNPAGEVYASTRQYATEELGVPADEVVTFLRLWRLMVTARDAGVPFDRWAALPKSRALAIRRAVDAHGDPARWLALSDEYPRAEEFDRAIRLKLGAKEVWETIPLRLPEGIAHVYRAAMMLAGTEVTGDPAFTPDRINDRDMQHQCVERICAEYVLARAGQRPS